MGLETIVALVVALTQTIKSWLKNWLNIPDENWRGWYSVLLSFFVSIGVAVYAALKSGYNINFNVLLVAIAAWALANGAKKILNSVRKRE
ncbi:MAG: hypothetical protein ACTSPV_00550 [Candidatus Hodarchaeales archaeon]